MYWLRLVCILSTFFLMNCVGAPPVKEYNLAASALKNAKDAGAQKHVPLLLNKSESYFRQAEQAYDDRNYESAIKLFKKVRKTAEKAELKVKIKKFQSGDSLP